MKINQTVSRQQGLSLRIVQTKKFKTNQFVFKFRSRLNENDVTARALIPYILQSSTKKWPTTADFRSHLDELYGAGASVDVNKKGEYHILSFAVDIPNERYLKDPTPLAKEALNVLKEMLFNPLLEGDSFSPKVIEQEKRTLKQKLQALKDDKMRYASQRLVEEMCKGEAYALHPNGSEEKLNQVTAEELYKAYRNMIEKDTVDLYVVGDVDSEAITSYCQKEFHFPEREPVTKPDVKSINTTDAKEVVESQKIKQGKLNIGYRTNIVYGDDDYIPLTVMNGLFGGFPHSKLFLNVREKESLAYYAASRVESHKGLVVVMSGVEPAKVERAALIIEEQLQAIQNGEVSENELNQTKAVLKNQMLETLDASRGIVEVLYQGEVADAPVDIDRWFEKVDAVTADHVIAAAKKLKKDTTYILTSGEE
ncbi:EF-P 5-aminopentanol modification-associated protein YfmF [Jeotgalibacillus sp. R-1-5s-1]|uniref:EF-P 5-aminopentanol modification-associated protein YfmF n=1 Tax=Jeotgalibacillus sp. R-1-5s-1 TaxID=2555897 RepID=UPI00106C451F|nr:pitrilysin family protein [Jeotgalibacillus sp. R-1-5s-1]TFE03437.1 insulinase family protein [Jeotgalibacillus sp. R-1-5s-1]